MRALGERRLGSSETVRWSALALCFSGNFAFTLTTFAYAPILTLIKIDLGLNYTEAGMIASAYFIGYAIGQFPWGILADRYGARCVVAASVFGAGASTSLFAFSGSGGEAVILRLVSGLSAAGVFVPSIRIISGWFPQSRRGMALGVLGAASSGSVFVLGFAMPYVSASFGWRLGMHLFAAVSIVDAAILLLFLRDPPAKESEHMKLPVQSFLPKKTTLCDSGFWIFGYVQFARYGLHNTLLAWTILFIVETFNFPLSLAGAVLSWMFAISVASDPAGGVISDKVGRLPIVSATFLVLASLLTGLVVNKNPWVLLILLGGVGWFVEFHRATSFAAVPERYGVGETGSVAGALNTFAAAGAFTLPLLFGYLRDISGTFAVGWILTAGVLSSAGILLAILPEITHRDSQLRPSRE